MCVIDKYVEFLFHRVTSVRSSRRLPRNKEIAKLHAAYADCIAGAAAYVASCVKFHASVSGSSSSWKLERRSDGSLQNTWHILGNLSVFSVGFVVVASNFSKYSICYAAQASYIRLCVHLCIYHVCLTFWRISWQMLGIIKCFLYFYLFANF